MGSNIPAYLLPISLSGKIAATAMDKKLNTRQDVLLVQYIIYNII